MASGPLTGFRIVDLSRVLSGPIATTLLADQGADVIKVEPLNGDLIRAMGGSGLSGTFVSANRGKRSIALDLRTPRGIDVVKKLVADADVFIQNFRPGAASGMGLGYDVLCEINPRLIYVSVSGFGEEGPYAHKRVYDPVIQALSGMADIQASSENDRPRLMRTVIPDKTTGLTVAQAITAALLSRERTGEGQAVDVAMLDALVSFLWPEGLVGLTFVGNEGNVKRGQRTRDLIYQTQDGYITAGALSNREWEGMCRALNKPEWLTDERFSTPRARGMNGALRLEMTAEVLATNTSAYWLERLDAEQVPCAPVLSRPEVIEHEQIKVNGTVTEYDHPHLGRIRQPRPAAKFGATPPATEQVAPLLGEHTRTLLTEAGYDEAAIETLITDGVAIAPG